MSKPPGQPNSPSHSAGGRGSELKLLLPREAWLANFFRNAVAVFQTAPPDETACTPAAFWTDVFVAAGIPLPNLVAWTPVPSPVPVSGSLSSKLTMPALPAALIAPPAEVVRTDHASRPELPQAAVVPPTPEVSRAGRQRRESLAQPSVVAP